jgi:hypothetical protein
MCWGEELLHSGIIDARHIYQHRNMSLPDLTKQGSYLRCSSALDCSPQIRASQAIAIERRQCKACWGRLSHPAI